jgi:A1 cistron-splicing factor AAR2
LNIPKGMELGIDNTIWKIGDKFKGIKLIPLGSHIICYSMPCENNGFKMSFFVNFSAKNRIMVRKWDETNQDFCKLSEEE